LAQKWQFLFTFAKNVSLSVWDVINTPNTAELFHLPLSVQAMHEYNALLHLVHTTQLSQDKDNWIVTDNGSGYKVSSAYRSLTKYDPVIPAIKWLWKSCCQDKHRVFFWLLIHNRLNTRALLQRKNFYMTDYTCIMCNQAVTETRDHLFFTCPFAQHCWQYMCPLWNLAQVAMPNDIQNYIQSIKAHIRQPFFMEIIILICWSIWTTRNDAIFKGLTPSLYRARRKLKDELSLLIHKAKRKSYAGLQVWVENFV
jgi:hypothetical protein